MVEVDKPITSEDERKQRLGETRVLKMSYRYGREYVGEEKRRSKARQKS